MPGWVTVPQTDTFELVNATVPACCLADTIGKDHLSLDQTVSVDIEVERGVIHSVSVSGPAEDEENQVKRVDCRGGMVWPTFTDLHTHIDKSHTCERSRNLDGSLSGADRSTAADATFWDKHDVFRRMDYSIRCAYAHGTSALRTHLINMTQLQTQLTWPAFSDLRSRWAGKVELQAVSLVVLSFFRNEAAAVALADTVQQYGGIMGAAICCAENGGDPTDDWTTCDRDRDLLLDRIFTLAKARDLDLDFHVDENGNKKARGLEYVARKTLEHGYQGRVVCGHCCSLVAQDEADQARIIQLTAKAGITVVSLPLVNEWTQDRDHDACRTPRWRGITAVHELRQGGVPVAVASDHVRDQFYVYGDLDMLEVFGQSCRICHLDRPYGDWPTAITSVPAAAMKLPGHGKIAVGGAANLVVFRARKFSELLSRPQNDRVVIRNGRQISVALPGYEQLDDDPEDAASGSVSPQLSFRSQEAGARSRREHLHRLNSRLDLRFHEAKHSRRKLGDSWSPSIAYCAAMASTAFLVALFDRFWLYKRS